MISSYFFVLVIIYTRHCNTGLLKNTIVSSKNVSFILLTTLKHGRNWKFLSFLLKIIDASFRRLVSWFSTQTSINYYKLFVEVRILFQMMYFISNGQFFFGFPEAIYSFDVTFQKQQVNWLYRIIITGFQMKIYSLRVQSIGDRLSKLYLTCFLRAFPRIGTLPRNF